MKKLLPANLYLFSSFPLRV